MQFLSFLFEAYLVFAIPHPGFFRLLQDPSIDRYLDIKHLRGGIAQVNVGTLFSFAL